MTHVLISCILPWQMVPFASPGFISPHIHMASKNMTSGRQTDRRSDGATWSAVMGACHQPRGLLYWEHVISHVVCCTGSMSSVQFSSMEVLLINSEQKRVHNPKRKSEKRRTPRIKVATIPPRYIWVSQTVWEGLHTHLCYKVCRCYKVCSPGHIKGGPQVGQASLYQCAWLASGFSSTSRTLNDGGDSSLSKKLDDYKNNAQCLPTQPLSSGLPVT